MKQLYTTEEGEALIATLNKAQDELIQQTIKKLVRIGMRLWKNWLPIDKDLKM